MCEGFDRRHGGISTRQGRAASALNERTAPASTATATASAAPGVVLCVADGIVRIVVHIVAGEDLGGRPRREINLLIGVAAGQDKRRDHGRDAEPPSRPLKKSLASGIVM